VESENLVRVLSDYIRDRKSGKAEKTVHDLADTPLTVHHLQKHKQQLQFLLIYLLIKSIIIIIIIIIIIMYSSSVKGFQDGEVKSWIHRTQSHEFQYVIY